jgi:formate-dependent nitrite reductase membrane component NrfD
VAIGTALLVLDLGRPFYFWKLVVAFAPQSPMWLGTWLLTLFLLVSVPYAALFLPAAAWFCETTWLQRQRRRLAWAALPLGAGVGVYTGVLLGVLVARPLWNTPLLAQVFLVSALSSGAALLLAAPGSPPADERHVLARIDALLIVVELCLLAWMLVDARTSTASTANAAALLRRGAYAWVFWIAVVGLGLCAPLALELITMRHHGRWVMRVAAAAPVLVLTGGLALRWVIVYAGQSSGLG